MSIASMFSNTGEDNPASAVVSRTEQILAGRPPADPIAALRELADSLPSLDDVRAVAEGDTSELTDTERQQKDKTESVIRTAVASGQASIWIIAQGLERAAKGKWWRRSHDSYEAYVKDITGRSASYVRRLRSAAPLALETASRTGRVPNPGQTEETRKVEKQYGTEAAILLFDVVAEVTETLGDQPTAEHLRAARRELPPTLPDVPEQQRAEIERAVRRTLGHGGGDETSMFEENSNDGVRIRTPSFEEKSNSEGGTGHTSETHGAGTGGEPASADDGILDAEIVPDAIADLKDALKRLNALNKAITKATFAEAAKADAAEAAKIRDRFLKTATALRNKALHAPTSPVQGGGEEAAAG
jgi:hypothetical protein